MMRLLLALAVVVAHAFAPSGFSFLEMTGGPLSVQIFYQISGFYMALILSDRYVGPGSTTAFYKNRFLRLYPVFAGALAATVIVFAALHFFAAYDAPPLAAWREHGASLSPLGLLLLGLSNLTLIGQDWVYFVAVDAASGSLYFNPELHKAPLPGYHFLLAPQAWTVAVELTFYAVAPFLLRAKTLVIAAVLLASLALRAVVMRSFEVWYDPWTYRFFPMELALFLSGVLSQRLYRARETRRKPGDEVIDRTVTGFALAAIALYALLPEPLKRMHYALVPALALMPLAFPFMFAATRTSKLDRQIGELSYPLYIVHFLVVFAMPAFSTPWIVEHGSWLIIVQSLCYAWLLQRFIAEPIERTRERISRSLPPPRPLPLDAVPAASPR